MGGLDLVVGPVVDDDAVDSGDVQQMRQREAGGASTDDGDPGARRAHVVGHL